MGLFYHDGRTIPEAPSYKDPSAVVDYAADFANWLSSDTISVSQWLVNGTLIESDGQTVDGLTVDSSSATTTKSTVWLSAGTEDESYIVTNRITTAAGRVEDRSFKLTVKQI